MAGQQSYAPIGVSPDWFPFRNESESRNRMREIFKSGSVGRAPGNRCLYPERESKNRKDSFGDHRRIAGDGCDCFSCFRSSYIVIREIRSTNILTPFGSIYCNAIIFAGNCFSCTRSAVFAA